nr:MAG TPA: hypothetical protein [Caudoviricetes sp.]
MKVNSKQYHTATHPRAAVFILPTDESPQYIFS